jgi:hypothetical protein
MKQVLSAVPHALALLVAGVFLDSLRYKFTNHPNTQVIFGKLDAWSSSLGAPGLFASGGLFSQYVIGSAELAAAVLLLAGILPRSRVFQGLGGLIAFMIMTGAVFFHLFTPLSTDPNNDGGGLFVAAVLVWFASLTLVLWRRWEILALGTKLLGK